MSFVEVVLGYVGAAATKSIRLGALILITARVFVPYNIIYPAWAIGFLVLTAVTFSMFGFIIGLWADSFQKLQTIPLMAQVSETQAEYEQRVEKAFGKLLTIQTSLDL